MGKHYEIHIIQECGQHGSILALLSDCIHHIRVKGNGFLMPAWHIQDLFFHMSRDMCVGYVTNHPGDITGKI